MCCSLFSLIAQRYHIKKDGLVPATPPHGDGPHNQVRLAGIQSSELELVRSPGPTCFKFSISFFLGSLKFSFFQTLHENYYI